MNATVKIAVVQQEVRTGRPTDNRSRALAHAGQALESGADLILFPQGMLVGYSDRYRELAEPADGFTAKAFRQLLTGTGAMVLYGLTEKAGKGYYLAATVVSAQGVVANYRKTHLWWAADDLRKEAAFFRPGDKLVTFDLKGHKCGIMICYDGDFPEMTRSYANMGCEMLFWLNQRQSRGPSEVRPLAIANTMIMATSCCCGMDEGGRKCPGGSNIVNHDGTVLAELWDAEGVICAEVSPSQVLERRESNPWYRGRRPELYVQTASLRDLVPPEAP